MMAQDDQIVTKDIDRQLGDWVVGLRRDFHRHPEPGFGERRTQGRIVEVLDDLGIRHRTAAGTGVVADIAGTGPGPTVALRADMDALHIQEAETELNRDYRSTVDGVSHACGHDGHMAMALGAARVLQATRDRLPGSVRLLFQPGEETLPGGAVAMIREGALDGVDGIFGIHLYGSAPAGELRFRAGPLMAHPCDFRLRITGEGGHHLNPAACVDPLSIAARFVATVRDDVAASLDPNDAWVLGIGSVHGGSQYNQTPDRVELTGSFRTFDEAVTARVEAAMRRSLDGLMRTFAKTDSPDVPSYELEVKQGYPVLRNDHGFVRRAKVVLGERFPGLIDDVRPNLGGEDFAYYLERVPGMFLFIGAGNRDRGIVHFNHSSRFDIEESVLLQGVEVLVMLATDFLAYPTEYRVERA